MQVKYLIVAGVILFGMLGEVRETRAEWQDQELRPPERPFATCRSVLSSGYLRCRAAEGGATGSFLWCHLKGQYEGRIATARRFEAAPLVMGKNNYAYAAAPVKSLTIYSQFHPPIRYEHAYLQMPIEEFGDRIAQDPDASIACLVTHHPRSNLIEAMSRSIDKDVLPLIQDYVSGTIDSEALLRAINLGVPKPF